MRRLVPLLLALPLALPCSASLALAEGDPPPPKPDQPLVPLATFFKGKVRSLKDRAIEIAYDFEDDAQLADFEASCPFRAIRTVTFATKRGRVHLQGTGSMRHKAVFEDKVSLAAVFNPKKPRDFGYAVSESRESEIFTLYCCYDRYFSAGDNVFVPQNMVIKFLAREAKTSKDGMQDWRYCGSRGQNPEIKVGVNYKVSMGRSRGAVTSRAASPQLHA